MMGMVAKLMTLRLGSNGQKKSPLEIVISGCLFAGNQVGFSLLALTTILLSECILCVCNRLFLNFALLL